MPLTELEFEDACCRTCPHCNAARDMAKLGQKGHMLRWRPDTREFVHDFVLVKSDARFKGTELTHAYCRASLMRRLRNG
jgi:hypothetical protein